MKIKILGSGCTKCKKLEQNTTKAVEAAGVNAIVEKVTDMNMIMDYGVMMTPALVIDEKVVSVGKLLTVEQIKTLLLK